MQPYTLVCLCIWILTLTTAMEIPAAATGVSVPRFFFGTILVTALAKVQIQCGFLYSNAAALLWPAYWLFACNGAKLRRRVFTPDMLIVCLPPAEAAVRLIINGWRYMYFTFELGADALNMEMTLWAVAMLLRCGAYLLASRGLLRQP